jgi:hypothetical protein
LRGAPPLDAEVSAPTGAKAFGNTKTEVIRKVEALVLRAPADTIEHGENAP